jgi:hypothetical protein
MDENEINELLKMLKQSVKRSDWDIVYDAIDYIGEFVDDEESDE